MQTHTRISDTLRRQFIALDFDIKRPLQAYYDMRQRCSNPKYKQYVNYGGRGISVKVDRDTFLIWFLACLPDFQYLHPGDSPTVNRIDNDKDYELSNMELVTRSENSTECGLRNRARNIPLQRTLDDMAVLTVYTYRKAKELHQHFDVSRCQIQRIMSGKSQTKLHRLCHE